MVNTVIELARQAGMEQDGEMVYSFQNSDKDQDVRLVDLERFSELVRADEREAVLDLVDDYAKGNFDLRDAIRARGNT